MRTRTWGWLCLAALGWAGGARADDSVTVPWPEFQQLYRESVERAVLKAEAETPTPVRPQHHALESAAYHLAIDKDRAHGEVLITGRVLAGDPAPIALFGADLIVSALKPVTGGTLVCGAGTGDGVAFLPDGTTGVFQVEFAFLVQPREDRDSRTVAFAVPAALQNTLRVELAPELRLVDAPGLAGADGTRHFAPAAELRVRFLDQQSLAAATLVEIDTFAAIRLQAERAVLTATLSPARPFPPRFTLEVPPAAQYVSSSLKPSWIREQGAGAFAIEIPADEQKPVTLQFALEATGGVDGLTFALPRVRENTGREGDFVVEEPEDGQVRVGGPGLVSDIPLSRLGATAARGAGGAGSYRHLPAGAALTLGVTRFAPVRAAPLVLDTQDFYVAFEENGNVLAVIVLDIPPEFGPRLPLRSVPGSEVWSLTVNGRARKLFANDAGDWIVPLDAGATSHVQLALLRKGEKLGLQGRLEAELPETGLSARRVRVGVALPARVQLLSLEGPLNPAPGEARNAPAEFVGVPHYFERTFHGGQAMRLAVAYKEPIKTAAN